MVMYHSAASSSNSGSRGGSRGGSRRGPVGGDGGVDRLSSLDLTVHNVQAIQLIQKV